MLRDVYAFSAFGGWKCSNPAGPSFGESFTSCTEALCGAWVYFRVNATGACMDFKKGIALGGIALKAQTVNNVLTGLSTTNVNKLWRGCADDMLNPWVRNGMLKADSANCFRSGYTSALSIDNAVKCNVDITNAGKLSGLLGRNYPNNCDNSMMNTLAHTLGYACDYTIQNPYERAWGAWKALNPYICLTWTLLNSMQECRGTNTYYRGTYVTENKWTDSFPMPVGHVCVPLNLNNTSSYSSCSTLPDIGMGCIYFKVDDVRDNPYARYGVISAVITKFAIYTCTGCEVFSYYPFYRDTSWNGHDRDWMAENGYLPTALAFGLTNTNYCSGSALYGPSTICMNAFESFKALMNTYYDQPTVRCSKAGIHGQRNWITPLAYWYYPGSENGAYYCFLGGSSAYGSTAPLWITNSGYNASCIYGSFITRSYPNTPYQCEYAGWTRPQSYLAYPGSASVVIRHDYIGTFLNGDVCCRLGDQYQQVSTVTFYTGAGVTCSNHCSSRCSLTNKPSPNSYYLFWGARCNGFNRRGGVPGVETGCITLAGAYNCSNVVMGRGTQFLPIRHYIDWGF